MSPFNFRRRAAARLARVVDFRLNERVHPLEQRLRHQEDCTDDHRRRLDALEAGIEQLRGDLRWTDNELERLMPHVAAQDARIESLREQIALVPHADKPELAEARSLIEEVQRQHAQIRVRLTGIARYEHRLRALEEQAAVTVGE
ncbi:hypothetical protein [Amycolatopsis suaedae]|uniref:Uncharacterized protein n=1 Tax=Amycolatopsis suaedae TaxID=2510978 RepID=A0A4Q7J5A9_9PSEU|nr:hypothetical protein [Amycolatopsis suaedae]RZQ62028.1 hypothetical protein EWH70_20760 [Amycolatopsis suaedae]